MGLLEKAYDTYINHLDLVGKIEEGKSPLIPIAHMLKNVDIEVTINIDGNFITAVEIDKSDNSTIIPATEKSSNSRTSGVEPHPLVDSLDYLSPGNTKKHQSFLELLSDWCKFDESNVKIQAVLKYVNKGSIKQDINSCCGKKCDDKKFVRWRVIGDSEADSDASWQSKKMFESWQNYYLKKMSAIEGLCMISGQKELLGTSHPKGIVANLNNSKLISANDSKDFTYRGRFSNDREAMTISYVASQYAHNALIWLTRNQSVRFSAGGRTFICWNPKGYKVPCVWDDILSLGDNEDACLITPTNYQKALYSALSGYRNNLPDNEDVILASFDAATPGRLSLTYYCELKGSDFLERLEKWYSTCNWINGKYGVQTPGIRDITLFAFGESREENYPEAKEGVFREQFQRVLKCVIDKAPIPYDLLICLVNRASRPQSYKSSHSVVYKRLLYITCALVRKYHNDRLKREEWTLNLEPEKRERSYQFGRLLAVMEKIETDTFSSDENRESNAIRLQSVFCERPWQYTEIIHQKLAPYFAKHKANGRRYYKRLIGQIMEELSSFPEQELNKKLNETYLLGYYLQRNAMYEKHAKDIGLNEGEE